MQSPPPLRFILIGAGGRGRMWCTSIVDPLLSLRLIEPVAIVDVTPDAFPDACAGLGLDESKCYTDADRALEENNADFVIISSPTQFHEEAVDAAIRHGADMLIEKPIAHTMDACCRIHRKVTGAGRKAAVVMSHRFDQDKQSLERMIKSGDHGKLDYLIGRNTWACRRVGTWGPEHRYRKPDVLLTEGTVHHFDIIRSLTGSNARTMHAITWNPDWSEFDHDAQALILMEMENGVKAMYEGAMTNATTLNNWLDEYFRAECESATLELDHRKLRHLSDLDGERKIREIPLDKQEFWLDTWITKMFVDWLQGGPEPPNSLDDNIQCAAMLYAAIESSHSGKIVDVQEFLRRHM
jgi:predicted dehydrogenase